MPMLRAVGDVARAHAIRAQVAVEEAMACGIGVCMTCVLPVRGDDGQSRFVRSCVEGPVFDADRVRWADVGTLPADLVGADAMGGALMADMTAPGSGPLELPNPVLTASGCAAAGRELHQFFDVATLGAVVTKSIMLAPRSGRPTPRMAETPSGMLNSIGLQGPGHRLVHRERPRLARRARRAHGRVDRRLAHRRVRRRSPVGSPGIRRCR